MDVKGNIMPQNEFDDLFEDSEPDALKPVEPQEDSGKHRPKDDVLTTPQLPIVDPKDRVVDLPELPTPEIEPHEPSPSIPGVREVTYSTPMNLQQAAPGAKGPWIQYNGVATVRIMTRKDWAAAGVQSEKYCEWNYLNGKRLPRSMFSDDELQYLLRVDGRFSLEKE